MAELEQFGEWSEQDSAAFEEWRHDNIRNIRADMYAAELLRREKDRKTEAAINIGVATLAAVTILTVKALPLLSKVDILPSSYTDIHNFFPM